MSAIQDFDQRRWEQDIASHTRYVEYAAQCKTERCRALFLERAREIQDRYPNHRKSFKALELSPPGDA